MLAKDAFDKVCLLIFENIEMDGWKYSKSQHWITKKDKKFIYQIRFYSSWRNVSDKNVAFYGEFRIAPLKGKNNFLSLCTNHFRIPDGKLQWNIAREELWTKAVNEFTNWLNDVCIPILIRLSNDLDNYIYQIVSEGFCPKFRYLIDVNFVLQFGSRELAEKATINYYKSLSENEKNSFKVNYESMINGGEAVSDYGRNWIRMYSNFKTIIENKIIVSL